MAVSCVAISRLIRTVRDCSVIDPSSTVTVSASVYEVLDWNQNVLLAEGVFEGVWLVYMYNVVTSTNVYRLR